MHGVESLADAATGVPLPALFAAVAIAIQCAALSVLIVLKRWAFLGQGITHAAFGGVGIAAIFGLSVGGGFAVVAVFCVLCAVGIGALSQRERITSDTAIAVALVGAMSLGAILIHLRLKYVGPAPMAQEWESLLFGSIATVTTTDAVIAWVVAAVVVSAIFVLRRPMRFWAFDEAAAESFGVATGAMRYALLVLSAVSIVVSMKLAGVALVTALLVLPGATALLVSRRMGAVSALSLAVALIGVMGGLSVAIWVDLPPGPSMVAVLVAIFTLCGVISLRFR